MAKTRKEKTVFFCRECGYEAPRWLGQCPACREWNTLVEEPAADRPGPSTKWRGNGAPKAKRLVDVQSGDALRIPTGVTEIDRVLGGGIVPGSVVLLAGDPGIGKSTLMTELARFVPDRTLLYVTGEESDAQVKLRAERLAVPLDNLYVLAAAHVEDVLSAATEIGPDFVVVDSIQTLYSDAGSGSPGSVGQVRSCAASLIQWAKETGTATFIVGHVTKDGQIAGPRVLEHMVDTVLYFEGDRHHAYRVLRTTKNRFGSTLEIGLFEMGQKGLVQVSDPSSALLSQRSGQTGSAIVCPIEGTRPLLVEIQALVSQATYGTPQRSVNGMDVKRAQMLLAVLEKRADMRLAVQDVFLNVAGGIRLDEPSVDLGVIVALASSHTATMLPLDTVFIGEVGLGGEVRSVSQLQRRLNEASRLGFRHAIVPANRVDVKDAPGLAVHPVESIDKALSLIL
ncbi:MAG: DNA repair protein RadA [Rhodothermales bacterium]|jgi:DNA repair protein RadA/Sms